jgi:2,4-dienoyl-CoA reductase (NADPH2)
VLARGSGSGSSSGSGYSYGSSSELPHVFSEVAVGPLQLPHRVVMGSMHIGLEAHGDDGRALAAFYAQRAAGGAALIVTGGCAVSRVGAGGRSYAFVNEAASASALARVADAVHAAGGRILLQLFHAGRYAFKRSFGLPPVAPSAVYSAFSRAEPHALSEAEVGEVIAEFAGGAGRAAELGYDGVELMGSEGYLLNQFMAPATNLRDDEWGGDAPRRMRFPLAVTRAVRHAVGPERAVVYRLSGADLVDGGTSPEEVLTLAEALAGEGLTDALNVGIGWHEARVPTVQLLVPHGAWLPWTRAVREVVSIPVIASNRINTLGQAEAALAAGDADLISLARPFLADPELIARGRDGRAVNVCIACDQACIDRSIFDQRVSCVVNPRAGHELQPAQVDLGGSTVAVVGGGPAGMEAARSLAGSGARVTVFEAAGRLGGQFRMACRIPGKEDYERTIEYFEAELEALGIQVRLRSAVGAVTELRGFDAIVLASGVAPRPVSIPGSELPHVRSYASLLTGDRSLPDGPVAIIGAGGIGVDVAHLLSHRASGDPRAAFYRRYGLTPPERMGEPVGRRPEDGDRVMSPPKNGDPLRAPPKIGDPLRAPAKIGDLVTPPVTQPPDFGPGRAVTLLRRGRRVGDRVGPSTRWALLAELSHAGVRTLTEVAYERIEPGTLHVRASDGTPLAVPAETVVIAAGQLSERSLAGALAAAGVPHIIIGGAHDATELDAERAFRDGLKAPAQIARLIGSRA